MAGTPPSDDSARARRGWDGLSREDVLDIIARRAVVDQAKGILMFVFNVDADTAFDCLRRRSRATQTKVGLLAAQLLIEVQSLTVEERTDMRSACEKILATLHRRVDQADGEH